MRYRKQMSIGLFVLSLILFGVQAGLWWHSTESARSETDKQNMEGHHPPSLFPAVGGAVLLIAAAVMVSIPVQVGHRPRG